MTPLCSVDIVGRYSEWILGGGGGGAAGEDKCVYVSYALFFTSVVGERLLGLP